MTAHESKPIDRWIPWFFVAFFAVFIAVDAVFLTFAIKTRPGVVTERAYEKGLAYNAALEEGARQAALGWQARAQYTGGSLVITVTQQSGTPVSGAQVTARILRPVVRGHDVEAQLHETAPGVYRGPVSLPLPGQWEVQAEIRRGDERLQLSDRLMIALEGR